MKDITIESGMQALTPFSPQKKGGWKVLRVLFVRCCKRRLQKLISCKMRQTIQLSSWLQAGQEICMRL